MCLRTRVKSWAREAVMVVRLSAASARKAENSLKLVERELLI